MNLAGPANLTWRKSRACASNACVEVADTPGAVRVRDSADPDRPDGIMFTAADWSTFIRDIVRGGQTAG